jgi:hypothetical protein
MKGFLPSEVAHYFNFSPNKKPEKDAAEDA